MSSFDSSSGGSSNTPFPSDAEVTDQVFITPRVLDQGAFREYTDSLKGLIREAGGRRTELRTDTDEARQLGENLSEAAQRLRERLETTAKLLPALDNRVRRAEAIMAQAADDAQLTEQIEKRFADRLEAMEARIAASIEAAEARLEAVEGRFAELHEQTVADMTQLESLRTELNASGCAAQDDLTRITEQTASFQAVSETLSRQAAEIPETTKAQLTHAVEAMDLHAEETIKRVQAVEMLSERAVRLLGFDPNEPGDEIAPDSLMMLVQRGDELERTARATASELVALHQMNDQAQDQLESLVDGAHGSVEQLTRQRDELVASMEEALGRLAGAQPKILEELVQVREQLSEIEARHERVEAGMGDISGELGGLEDAVAERLGNLRALATKELSRLQIAVAAQRRSLGELAAKDGIFDRNPNTPQKETDPESVDESTDS